MSAFRSVLPPGQHFSSGRRREGADRTRLCGWRRVVLAYGVSLLAGVLALPVAAAGVVTSNNCQIRGFDCFDRMTYGLIGAIVLAAVAQLMLSLHFGLGWSFWIGCSLIMSTALPNATSLATVVAILALAPGIAAWASEPPNRRHGVLAHWGPRYATLLVVVVAALAAGLSA